MNSSKIQIFIEDLVLSGLSILKIILMSDLFIKYFKPQINESGKCIILGNGPSLIDSLENDTILLSDNDLVCVNFFPETQYYKKLKPKYYITSAPELWINDVSEEWQLRRTDLFHLIKNQTDWDIIFLIPSLAKKHAHWRDILSLNSHIIIKYYNITPIDGFKWFKHFCFRNNLGTPRAHNILTPSLMQMLNFGYKKIYLLGADHSWLNEIKVDSENRVLIRQKHFYDNDTAKFRQMGNIQMGVRKLHEVLHKFYHTFAGYFAIKEYAESIDAEIINATTESYIDAFKRGTID